MISSKGRLRAVIFKSTETVHHILLCYLDDALRCPVSADVNMVARNRPLIRSLIKVPRKIKNKNPSLLEKV